MKARRWIILPLLVTAIACFFIFDLGAQMRERLGMTA